MIVPSPDAPETRLLAAYLQDRDAPCPRCGYNLRGTASGRCPECGDRLTIQVGLVEPRLGAYITMLIGASLGAGGGGLFGLIALVAAPRDWWSTACGRALMALIIIGVILLPALLVARRRIRRRSRRTQWLIALGVCTIMLGLSIVVLLTFDD